MNAISFSCGRSLQHSRLAFWLTAVCALSLSGCTSLLSPMSGIPASQLPPELRGQPRNNLVPVPLALLRQKVPDNYLLDSGDILGVYIEGILPPREDGENATVTAPPVYFPEKGSDLPPAVGYPIPVREDGTLALPLVEPLSVKGKSMVEVERMIQKAYVEDKKVLKEGRDRILVSLMRERTYRVIVIREDKSQELAIAGGQQLRGLAANVITGSERSGSGYTLDLPAYKNDIMHALAETGGLPGLNAKNEVKVIKAKRAEQQLQMGMMGMMGVNGMMGPDGMMGPCGMCGPEMDPCHRSCQNEYNDPTAIRIPLRVQPGMMPQVSPEDVILEEGDMIVIEARDTEVFYTGGLLPGGQFPIPRDYDLDVIGAMSIAGQGLYSAGRAGGAGGGGASAILGGGFGGASPTQLYVIRKTPCGDEFNISVDLTSAMNNPSERLLVQPGDTLILRYKPCEEAVNFGLVAFFTFGISELLRN